MRRILQSQGAEVIHLGHNRSVDEIVRAAVQEDVQGVAVSSYQGGHIEYFRYLVDRLRAEGRPDVEGVRRRRRRDRARRDRRAARLRRHPHLLARGRPAPRPGPHGQHDRRGLRRRPRCRSSPRSLSTTCWPATSGRWPGPSPPSRSARSAATSSSACARPPPGVPCRCSASPAPAGRASRRSPTSWSAASASTRRTSSASRCSPSTRPGGEPAGRCSATASA